MTITETFQAKSKLYGNFYTAEQVYIGNQKFLYLVCGIYLNTDKFYHHFERV